MHMKRYVMPKFWPIGKKQQKYVVTPLPGPHQKNSSIPLVIVLRDVLKLAQTSTEAKNIVNKGLVFIDKKRVNEHRHPVGLMDVIEFPEVKKYFRVVSTQKGLGVTEIQAKEADKKLCVIKGKKILKGGKFQLSLHDGRTLLVGKDNKYKPSDTLLIELPGQKILSHWQIKEGIPAVVISGRNKGLEGKVKSVYRRKNMLEKSRVVLDTKAGDVETLYDYVLVGEVK